MRYIDHLSEMGIKQSNRVLILMPHPDDEAVFISGLLQKLSSSRISTRVVTLTAGEKSTLRHGLSPSANLTQVRKQELANAFKILGVTNFSILDYPDGELEEQTQKIKSTIIKEIKSYQPTHLITLEPDGVYGHPDHIAVSEIITNLVNSLIKLIYITVSPNYIFPTARAMAKKSTIKPLKAQYCLHLTFPEAFNKIKALHTHRSQFTFNPFQTKSLIHFLRNGMFTHEYFSYK